MPRIKGSTLGEHHEIVWQTIAQAVDGLLDERGYDGISLADIADRSGVSRNSLYRYAPDKTALMVAVADRVSEPVRVRIRDIANSSADSSERIYRIVDELLRAFDTSAIRLMLHPAVSAGVPLARLQGPGGPFEDVAKSMRQVIREGGKSGDFQLVADDALVTRLLSGIMVSAADVITNETCRPSDLVPIVHQLLLNALGSAKTL